MEDLKLEPCPKCGGVPEFYEWKDQGCNEFGESLDGCTTYKCSSCGSLPCLAALPGDDKARVHFWEAHVRDQMQGGEHEAQNHA